jgi:hypothetical protein
VDSFPFFVIVLGRVNVRGCFSAFAFLFPRLLSAARGAQFSVECDRMLCEGNLRSVEKLCAFRYRESLRISTRTANASVVAATTVLGFNDIYSFIRVHTRADSAELVGSLDGSRVFINLTVMPWPSLKLSVSPNENGVVNFEYSRQLLSLPETDMSAVFCLSSQNLIPVCSLRLKRSFAAGFLDMRLFTKFEKEYSVSGEFRGALN